MMSPNTSKFVHFTASTFISPYFHQFSLVVQNILCRINLLYRWFKSIMIYKIDAGTTHCKGPNWDEFSEEHQHQSIKKHKIRTF